MAYEAGQEVQVDVGEAFGRNAGGEIGEGMVVSDKGDKVTLILRCFAFPDGHEVTVPKDSIL